MEQHSRAQDGSTPPGMIHSEAGKRKALQIETGQENFELPESMKDLDLNKTGFEEEAFKLPAFDMQKVLKRDDLKCQSEDQVLNFTLNYIDKAQQKIFHDVRVALF